VTRSFSAGHHFRLRPHAAAALLSVLMATSLAATLTPAPAGAAAASSPAKAKKSAAHVLAYDKQLLADSNAKRKTHKRHKLTMSTRLWKIAHAYAAQLAKTNNPNDLDHNPKLFRQVSKSCPKWLAMGENVGYDQVPASELPFTSSVLFTKYMHSPSHRKNILNKHYADLGSASVQGATDSDGLVTIYNVTDFANHCP
jgi:uncharacterized protein YkwD